MSSGTGDDHRGDGAQSRKIADAVATFLRGSATGGPAVGVGGPDLLADSGLGMAFEGFDPAIRSCTIPGTRLRTLDEVYREFAHAWDFPGYFGANKDAFDECMRELDDPARPTTGFVTVIPDAQSLLADDPGFTWFASSVDFYREHYRDVASPPHVFAYLLTAPDRAGRDAVVARWRAAGVEVAPLSH